MLSTISTFAVTATDIEASEQQKYELGQKRSFICAECHGENGVSQLGIYPNLAGQKLEYLISALTAYQQGLRQNETMQDMVINLSQQDIENLALYYSEQNCD